MWVPLVLLLRLAAVHLTAADSDNLADFPDEHMDIVFLNKVKFDSHVRSFDLPLHSLVEETKVVPLTARSTRRKRCSCGCSGCDIFPNRPCCSSSCCSSAPLPLACCPPPPPPKPCCQPAFGPCCPATPNCCPNGCCRGRRPEYEEYEEEGNHPPPAPPSTPRTCCPAAVPPPPPPPPAPPPPPPEPPVQCCGGQQQPRTCNGCNGGDCGCGRPCCYYKNPNCCDQVTGVVKPCCPPVPPPLPCCPEIPLPQLNCLATVPPCLRACPTCPCRKRLALGKRSKRHDALHCQPSVSTPSPAASTSSAKKEPFKARAAAAPTLRKQIPLEEGAGVVQSPPRAGRLYEEHRALRVKRAGCSICIGGRPIIRHKRSLDCQRCAYLQPQATSSDPFAAPQLPTSPVGVPLKREKRANCLPHPQCTLGLRRSKRNFGSQYCEPCGGGYYGRKKREAERDQCMRREKRATQQCEADEFEVNARMKRQAYNPKGILDIVKVLSKSAASESMGGGGTCMKFPACVLASKKRRKRHADRLEQYHKAVAEHKQALADHAELVAAHEEHIRTKRQFFAPDNAGSCVPCPAWVTLALASRKKREAEEETPMTLKEAIADIRKRKGYEQGFNDDSPRRKQSCTQTDDCLNEVEYAIFKKVYHTRTKRDAVFRRKKCQRCGSGFDGKRAKRSFGGPDVNASEHNCLAFPQCRHRVKRNFFDDCNVCTPHLDGRKRKKRNLEGTQCYPCPGTGK